MSQDEQTSCSCTWQGLVTFFCSGVGINVAVSIVFIAVIAYVVSNGYTKGIVKWIGDTVSKYAIYGMILGFVGKLLSKIVLALAFVPIGAHLYTSFVSCRHLQ